MLIDAGVGDKMGAEGRRDLRHRSRARTSTTRWPPPALAAGRHRRRARVAPALRSRRRVHGARRRPASCRVSARARTSSGAASGRMRRIRTSAIAPATSPENFVPLQEAGVVRLHRRRRRGAAGHQRVAHRRPHDASSDRPDRVGRPDGGLRGRSDPDDRARRRAVDHGLRPLSDGHAGVQAARSCARRSTREYVIFFEHDPASPPASSARRTGRLYVEPISQLSAELRAVPDLCRHDPRSASSAAAVCTTWPS